MAFCGAQHRIQFFFRPEPRLLFVIGYDITVTRRYGIWEYNAPPPLESNGRPHYFQNDREKKRKYVYNTHVSYVLIQIDS